MGIGRGVGKVATAPAKMFGEKKKKEQEAQNQAVKLANKAKASGKYKGRKANKYFLLFFCFLFAIFILHNISTSIIRSTHYLNGM